MPSFPREILPFISSSTELFPFTIDPKYLNDFTCSRWVWVMSIPSNAHIYITVFPLYIMFTPTCFDTSVSSSGSFKNVYFAKLHKFLELRLLKLKFHKIFRWKLFGHRWVIQYSLDVRGSVHHNTNLIEMTNKMQLCRTVYYSIVPWLLNMFQAILTLIIRSS